IRDEPLRLGDERRRELGFLLPARQEPAEQVALCVNQNTPLLRRDVVVRAPLRELVRLGQAHGEGLGLGAVVGKGLGGSTHQGQRVDLERCRLLVGDGAEGRDRRPTAREGGREQETAPCTACPTHRTLTRYPPSPSSSCDSSTIARSSPCSRVFTRPRSTGPLAEP